MACWMRWSWIPKTPEVCRSLFAIMVFRRAPIGRSNSLLAPAPKIKTVGDSNMGPPLHRKGTPLLPECLPSRQRPNDLAAIPDCHAHAVREHGLALSVRYIEKHRERNAQFC